MSAGLEWEKADKKDMVKEHGADLVFPQIIFVHGPQKQKQKKPPANLVPKIPMAVLAESQRQRLERLGLSGKDLRLTCEQASLLFDVLYPITVDLSRIHAVKHFKKPAVKELHLGNLRDSFKDELIESNKLLEESKEQANKYVYERCRKLLGKIAIAISEQLRS